MARNRTYRILHEPLLHEWLMRTYPPGTWRTNVRVGPVAPELKREDMTPEEARMLKIVVGSVDGLVLLRDKVVIVECMIRDEPGKIQHLKNYRQLFLADPEFAAHHKKPIELVLLTPLDNPFIRAMAEREGVRYVHYRPAWIEPLLGQYPKRIGGPRFQGLGPVGVTP